MPRFGKRSKSRLNGVNSKLVNILNESIKLMDLTVLEGMRSKERQKVLVANGSSKTMKSKHLKGRAVDVTPYPVDMESVSGIRRHYYMAGMLRGIAHMMKISVRSGADWDSDGEITDQKFNDLVHLELRDVR
jgi:peptidoglycan L-alanyl-D-glutamate endopeptidase CwlK